MLRYNAQQQCSLGLLDRDIEVTRLRRDIHALIGRGGEAHRVSFDAREVACDVLLPTGASVAIRGGAPEHPDADEQGTGARAPSGAARDSTSEREPLLMRHAFAREVVPP